MNTFFDENVKNEGGFLSEQEAKHCINVLRHKKGDKIRLLNGQGLSVVAEITETGKSLCRYKVLDHVQTPEKPFCIHLAIAPTKNTDRMEWMAEKLTEIGVDEITFILSENSERKRLRTDRIEKKVLSAMKQSKNPFKPQINDIMSFRDFIRHEHNLNEKFIAQVHPDHPYFADVAKRDSNILILIGPEGDFSGEEVSIAKKHGFKPVELGRHTLRTETAGLMACQTINFINGY